MCNRRGRQTIENEQIRGTDTPQILYFEPNEL